MSDLTPDQIRNAEFRSAIRGVDRVEVEALLSLIADRVGELESEHEKLVAQLGEASSRDLESEFESIGREVTAILQSAREAAEAMRERAGAETARWRAEAMAEAEENRREAAADAEALRRDAWAAGTELLEQSQAEATRIRDQAERDVLTTMGEAEREAHRLTSGARRDAEDLLRNAAMDSEKMTSEAMKRRDDIIEQATRQASAAQERTRALEQRRDELLEELENVRTTLTKLEGSLDEKRETLELTTQPDVSTSVRVVPSSPVDIEDWAPGETVRIVKQEGAAEQAVEEPEPEPAVTQPQMTEATEQEPETESVEEVAAPPAVEEEPEVQQADPTPAADEIDALFAALRSSGEAVASGPEVAPVSDPVPTLEPEPEQRARPDGTDWIDERDARLLPITNRALRGVKKAMTELQNIALDSLRTDEDWLPDEKAMVDALNADLVALWAESFAAGHAVAEEMTASKIKRPPTPPSAAATEFATALTRAVAGALDAAGASQRERQSAASKVFRVWRTDEAERKIRAIAIKGYEAGIEASVHAGV